MDKNSAGSRPTQVDGHTGLTLNQPSIIQIQERKRVWRARWQRAKAI